MRALQIGPAQAAPHTTERPHAVAASSRMLRRRHHDRYACQDRAQQAQCEGDRVGRRSERAQNQRAD